MYLFALFFLSDKTASRKNMLDNSKRNLFLQPDRRKAVPVPVQLRVSDLKFTLEQTEQGRIKTLTALRQKKIIQDSKIPRLPQIFLNFIKQIKSCFLRKAFEISVFKIWFISSLTYIH